MTDAHFLHLAVWQWVAEHQIELPRRISVHDILAVYGPQYDFDLQIPVELTGNLPSLETLEAYMRRHTPVRH
jgi:hypothetical protein